MSHRLQRWAGFGLVVFLGGTLAAPGAMRFSNVTASAGVNHHFIPVTASPEVSWMSGGFALEDFNGDGRPDIYQLEGGGATNQLYINRGDGTFTNRAEAFGLDFQWEAMGAAAADYDNDGDVDLAVTRVNGLVMLLANEGNTGFVVRAALDTGQENLFSPSWGDVDNDGLLELVVGAWNNSGQNLFLFRNTGAALEPYAFRTAPYQDLHAFSPHFADLNGDGWLDLPVTADFDQSQLYLNRGYAGFERVTAGSGTASEENGMGVAIGDYDNDGDLDWFVASIRDTNGIPEGNWGSTGNRLYQNNGDATFVDATDAAGVRDGNWGWGSAFGDLDNDGDLDLYHVNGWAGAGDPAIPPKFNHQPARLFENMGGGAFTDIAAAAGADDTGQGRGMAFFDYDADGDLDIYIANNQVLDVNGTNITRSPGPPLLLRNDEPEGHTWLRVEARGVPPYHRHGVGARVYLTAGGSNQLRELHASTGFLAQGPGRVAHFGLDTNTLAEAVRMVWPGGDQVTVSNVAAGQQLLLPGPSATVWPRKVVAGETVTLDATSAAEPGFWQVEGQVISQAVAQVVLTNAGLPNLTRQLLQPGGAFLRSEQYRVEVIALNAAQNRAPQLNESASFALTPVLEDDTQSAGELVSDFLGGAVTDLDPLDPKGLALFAANVAHGTFQFSTNGGAAWSNVGSVSKYAALLLGAQDRVRVVPPANYNALPQPCFAFVAWDQSSGGRGERRDIREQGSTNAFSSGTATGTVTVTAVNDPPVLFAPSSLSGLEDVPLAVTGWRMSDLDLDEAGPGELAVDLSVTQGVLTLTAPGGVAIDAGANGTTGLTVRAAPPILSNALASLTYTTFTNQHGADQLRVVLRDLGYTGTGGEQSTNHLVTLSTLPVNDSPALERTVSNVVMQEDATGVFADISGVFSDPDVLTDGDVITAYVIGNTSNELLTATATGDRVDLVVQPDAYGFAEITVAGLDQQLAQTQTTFSVTVEPVNDPPVVAQNPPPVFALEDVPPADLSLADTFSDPEQQPLVLAVASNSEPALLTPSLNGSLLHLVLSTNASGTSHVYVAATDTGGASVGVDIVVTVSAQNDPPYLAAPIGAVSVTEDAADRLVTLTGHFSDPDLAVGDQLTFQVLSNSAPQVVTPQIESGDLRLRFVPGAGGQAQVTVRARDTAGLFADDTFDVTVRAENDAPVLTPAGLALDPVREGVPPGEGMLVADLLGQAPPAYITDEDAGALQGIAVVAANGPWACRLTPGGSWTELGVSNATARLLAADGVTRIRFVPEPGFVGPLPTGLVFHAWDQTAGTNGERGVLGPTGGSNAVSIASDVVSVVVLPARRARHDFDADRQSDIGVIDPVAWNWFLLQSAGGIRQQQFGFPGVHEVAADYDGDGVCDLAVYYQPWGQWYVLESGSGAVRLQQWGYSLTEPSAADFDGDGEADFTVFEPATGNWYIRQSQSGVLRLQNWGYAGVRTVPADYDGDQVDDPAVYDPLSGWWYVLRSSDAGIFAQQWGYAGTLPVPGDYDGDGQADLAVYETSSGTWFIRQSSDGGLVVQRWGYAATQSVTGDFDGDGRADPTVFEPASGTWYSLGSTDGFNATQFGYQGVEVIGGVK